ncbi:MAG: tautomerase PptA [Lachnospiraceae bacterium]|nr:tautomerase PptA [Lachnospiraceae bacterium]
MPHVDIKCFVGRTDDQKKICAEKIADVIADTLVCDRSSVSVSINDIDKDDWKDKVWDKYIEPEMGHLYKKPGYSYD